jgi:hypothetical protein
MRRLTPAPAVLLQVSDMMPMLMQLWNSSDRCWLLCKVGLVYFCGNPLGTFSLALHVHCNGLHTRILPTEPSIFPWKMDFELTTLQVEVEEGEWETVNSHIDAFSFQQAICTVCCHLCDTFRREWHLYTQQHSLAASKSCIFHISCACDKKFAFTFPCLNVKSLLLTQLLAVYFSNPFLSSVRRLLALQLSHAGPPSEAFCHCLWIYCQIMIICWLLYLHSLHSWHWF